MDISDNLSVESKTLKVNVYTSLVALSVLLVSWIVMSQSLKLKAFGKKIDKIPGPFSIPILGTLVLIIIPRSEILEVIIRWTRKFKDGCFRLWLLNEPVIFISSPDHVQKILGSKEHLEKAALYQVLKPLIGNGLITADVPSWKAHRRLLINSVNGKMKQDGNVQPLVFSLASLELGLGCSPLKRYEEDINAATQELFDYVVSERRKQRQTHDINTNEINTESSALKNQKHIGRGALIDTLLDAAEHSENEITDEYMKNELMTFLVAGHDTSSETMLWALFMLGSHPELQDKVHDEMKEIFGDNRTPEITLDDLSRMTYLDQCIKETLRVYPSVPLLMRKVNTDVELEPDLIIPAGAEVAFCIPAIHQNPSVYKNPKKFDPERFAADKIADIHPYGYCPFSLGPRNCIGKRLGEVLTKIVLAGFFLNYSVTSLQKPEEVKTVAEVTLGPSKPIFFHVKRR
ncbi:Cytochrome P450 4C1 [Orchesella cincta]|uniref:Cytochrome P450 4C1 n=1 Tax=Orchesella cincta TaxID=48709 RepID=A0A1D2M362_ORCCI|nr:Cytochrome P450 4C1 [Orchesella cincta]